MTRRATQVLALAALLGLAVLTAAARPSRATPPDWPAAKGGCRQLGGDFRPWELYGIDNTTHHIVVYSCFFQGAERGGAVTESSLVANPKYARWTRTCTEHYGGSTSTFERDLWVGPGPNDFAVDVVYATCTIGTR